MTCSISADVLSSGDVVNFRTGTRVELATARESVLSMREYGGYDGDGSGMQLRLSCSSQLNADHRQATSFGRAEQNPGPLSDGH